MLIFDEHLSHISAQTVELSLNENISLIKLPAHCTDLLQPLDVSCFSPLKSYFEKGLTDHVHNTLGTQPLSKALFTNILGRIWHEGLSESNIQAGFRATGIFPVNASKYKESGET